MQKLDKGDKTLHHLMEDLFCRNQEQLILRKRIIGSITITFNKPPFDLQLV